MDNVLGSSKDSRRRAGRENGREGAGAAGAASTHVIHAHRLRPFHVSSVVATPPLSRAIASPPMSPPAQSLSPSAVTPPLPPSLTACRHNPAAPAATPQLTGTSRQRPQSYRLERQRSYILAAFAPRPLSRALHCATAVTFAPKRLPPFSESHPAVVPAPAPAASVLECIISQRRAVVRPYAVIASGSRKRPRRNPSRALESGGIVRHGHGASSVSAPRVAGDSERVHDSACRAAKRRARRQTRGALDLESNTAPLRATTQPPCRVRSAPRESTGCAGTPRPRPRLRCPTEFRVMFAADCRPPHDTASADDDDDDDDGAVNFARPLPSPPAPPACSRCPCPPRPALAFPRRRAPLISPMPARPAPAPVTANRPPAPVAHRLRPRCPLSQTPRPAHEPDAGASGARRRQSPACLLLSPVARVRPARPPLPQPCCPRRRAAPRSQVRRRCVRRPAPSVARLLPSLVARVRPASPAPAEALLSQTPRPARSQVRRRGVRRPAPPITRPPFVLSRPPAAVARVLPAPAVPGAAPRSQVRRQSVPTVRRDSPDPGQACAPRPSPRAGQPTPQVIASAFSALREL
ncbi:hypothetical protein B0H15DRAFT_1024134 [Mycena belliarum]|uniref:Uncharacterized protein n=1 Tax=Mycena belliarum TaxID=1033014 RepID=A0AAD6XJN6_9AGAR|nr:hypothetical protein B0H15DRAFT_1024134 [Mycena belliae]